VEGVSSQLASNDGGTDCFIRIGVRSENEEVLTKDT
jgi:hypothetical protein